MDQGIKNPRAKALWDKWRHVWMMAWERDRRLKDKLSYLNELENVKNFNWEEWRKRFLKFHNNKKSRVTDLMRKLDEDADGFLQRDGEFVEGILKAKFPSSRLEMNAVAGIMVTASHNPKQDDGYKVYASDGCQIRAPMDSDISKEIMANLAPWKDYGAILADLAKQSTDDPCMGLSNPEMTQSMTNDYFAALKTANDTGDIDDLAMFLQKESFDAIEGLLNYVPSPLRGMVTRRRRNRSPRLRNSPETVSSHGSSGSISAEEKKEDDDGAFKTPQKMGS